MIRALRLGSGAVLVAALAACSANGGRAAETERNRAVVIDFARLFYDKRDVKTAFETYVVPAYIQHNAGIADGRDAAVAALTPMFSAPGARFEVKKIIVDGDMAVIHLHGQTDPANPGGTVADIYRLKDGKIVEHWDVLQPIAPSKVNPHPYF